MSNVVKYTFVAQDKFSAELNKINEALGKTGRNMAKVGKEAKQTSVYTAALSDQKAGLMTVAGRWIGLAAAVGTGRKAINSAAAAQKALNKTMSNAANLEMKTKLRPEVQKQIDLLRTYGFSIDEIDRALYKMTSMQGLTQDTLDRVAGATDLAIGGYTDLEAAIGATNKQLEAFADLGGDSKKAARQIFEAQRIGDTSVEELTQFAPMAAGVAGSMGLSSAEYLSTISIFAKPLKGLDATVVGLRGVLTEIKQGASGQNKTQLQARARLGLPRNEVEFRKQGGIVPFLEKILRARSTDQGKLMLAKAFTNMEAMRLLDFITPERLDELKKGIGMVETGTNLDDEVKTRMQSLEISLNQLTASVDKLLAELGTVIGPAVQALARTFGSAVTGPAGGRVNTPKFISGLDPVLETGSRFADIIGSPIAAAADMLSPTARQLNSAMWPIFNPGKENPYAEINITLEGTGFDVKKTAVTKSDLDVGVQER